MSINISKSILRSILVNKKVGTIITSKKYEKLRLWFDEIKPYLNKLQDRGYIENFGKSIDVEFKILKPISLNTITDL